jgi:hypothetical protein
MQHRFDDVEVASQFNFQVRSDARRCSPPVGLEPFPPLVKRTSGDAFAEAELCDGQVRLRVARQSLPPFFAFLDGRTARHPQGSQGEAAESPQGNRRG